MTILGFHSEGSSPFLAPPSFVWTDFSQHGTLPDVPDIPVTVVVGFLDDFATHGGIVGARFQRVGSVVKEVCTSFVVEGVALVTFDGVGAFWTALSCHVGKQTEQANSQTDAKQVMLHLSTCNHPSQVSLHLPSFDSPHRTGCFESDLT